VRLSSFFAAGARGSATAGEGAESWDREPRDSDSLDMLIARSSACPRAPRAATLSRLTRLRRDGFRLGAAGCRDTTAGRREQETGASDYALDGGG